MSRKSRKEEPQEEKTGRFAGGSLAFVLGAAAALVVQRFWRQIVRGTVTGAVRTQRRIREISAEVMEDVEDAWAEESAASPASPGETPTEPPDNARP